MRRILAVLNARAGTFLDGQVRDPADVLRRAFEARGDRIETILAKPKAMGEHLKRARASEADIVIVGGGDGSATRAIEILEGAGKTLGVLPLGTMNVLARDLGIPNVFEEAVDALVRAEPVEVDLGTINGRTFHSLCGLGYFAQVARARERLRDLPLPVVGRRIAWALSHLQALVRSGRLTVTIATPGGVRTIEAYAVLATVNRFSGSDWRRERLDGGEIELHVAHNVSTLRRALLGRDMMTGAWRDNPDVETFVARSITVASARPRRWSTRDGELERVSMPITLTVKPKALTLLAAPPS